MGAASGGQRAGPARGAVRDRRRELGADWDQEAARHVAMYRAAMTIHLDDPAWTADFARFWASSDDPHRDPLSGYRVGCGQAGTPRASERRQMIARIWRGWASQATADDYQRHYETEVSRHLQDVTGFCGARLLRRSDGQEVMFTSVAFFISIDAVRSFAGEDYEQAIVEEAARRALNRWDERASHHDVSVDLPGPS